MDKKDLRIVYMGTPEFAVTPLKMLVEQDYNIVGVVTNPDKPAGRGQKVQESAVKQYAKVQNLTILQPEKFKDPLFVRQLSDLNADFNLHASLLPQYRGAAPINWAIINGEQITGLTTFFLKHEIDTGNIVFREEIEIDEKYNAGLLHDQLMEAGAKLVIKTVDAIIKGKYPQLNQSEFIKPGEKIKTAPKIFKDNCRINWSNNVDSVYNHIRGLSPYPAAWTELKTADGEIIAFKIFDTTKEPSNHSYAEGSILTDKKNYLKIAVADGFINIIKLQQAGKKPLLINEFLRGFQKIELCELI